MLIPSKHFYIEVAIPRADLEAQMERKGGVRVLGLYHGKRRVRAIQIRNWDFVLSDSERDLIDALGGNCIPDGMRDFDLSEFGLARRSEIAPVRIEPSDTNELTKIIRTDDWGDGAIPVAQERAGSEFRDKTKPFELISYALFILALPLFTMNMSISKRLSQRGNGIALIVYVGLCGLLGFGFPGNDWLKILLGIYVLGSALPFFAVSAGNRENPYSKKISEPVLQELDQDEETIPVDAQKAQSKLVLPKRPFLES